MVNAILGALLLAIGLGVALFGLFIRGKTREKDAFVGRILFFQNDWKIIELAALVAVAVGIVVFFF